MTSFQAADILSSMQQSSAATEQMLREAVEFGDMLDSVDEALDSSILAVHGQRDLDPKQQAQSIFNEYNTRRKRVQSLEQDILRSKEDARVRRNVVTGLREKVKMTQAELSCLLLEVHALETERNKMLNNVDPMLEERKVRDTLQDELLKLKHRNLKYPPVLADLNSETVRLEQEIQDIVAKEKTYITMLKERCVATGQELHQQTATEEEWGELRLLISEQETEIREYRHAILEKGGTLPRCTTTERQRYEATLRNKKVANVTRYFSIPTGTLRYLATVQGHGVQATRAKHNVVVNLDLGDAWANNVLSISGSEEAVQAASKEIRTLCGSALEKKENAVLTYPRPENRAVPISTPWAKMQRQRAEVGMQQHLDRQA